MNKTKELDPIDIARGILTECLLSGQDKLLAIEESVKSEMQTGTSPTSIRDCMIFAWRDYQRSAAKLRFTFGAVRFFREGHWKNRDAWAWADGQRPEPQPRYVDASRIYSGPEYEAPRRAAGGAA